MFNIKELKTNDITVENKLSIGSGEITYEETNNSLNLGCSVLRMSGEFECGNLNTVNLNTDNLNTTTINTSDAEGNSSNLTVIGNIVTGSDISCNNMNISGKSSFKDIEGTNMVFINKGTENGVVIKSLIKDNNFIAVAYTPDTQTVEVDGTHVQGTNHTVHSFIRLNSDGIVLWGDSIQLYADDLESYPHGSYINIESIHKY